MEKNLKNLINGVKPKRSNHQPLAAVLNDNRIAVANALEDPSLSAPLQAFSYPAERITEGKTKVESAETAYNAQRTAYDMQYNAVLAFNEARKAAEDSYNKYVYVARMLFKDDPYTMTLLHLSGKRKRMFGVWVQDSFLFYSIALNNPGILESFAACHVTAEDLAAGRDLVETARKAEVEKEKARAEAQKATETRDTAFTAMGEWMMSFLNIARLAFIDDRQQLEKLRIKA